MVNSSNLRGVRNMAIAAGLVAILGGMMSRDKTDSSQKNPIPQIENSHVTLPAYSSLETKTLIEVSPSSISESSEVAYVSNLVQDLKNHEGLRNFSYNDTKGKRTIGYGLNLDRGRSAREAIESLGLDFNAVYSGSQSITDEQAELLLRKDVELAKADAIKYLGKKDFDELNPEAQDILVNLSYNLGLPSLSGFKNLREALKHEDYVSAAAEMRNSKWFRDVGYRGQELSDRMENIRR